MTSRTTANGRIDPGRRSGRIAEAPTHDGLVGSEECCDVPPCELHMESPDDETLAALAKAIGHPTRLKILRLLTSRNECVTGEVVDELRLAQSTVSEHLRILREAGLIQGQIEGPRTRYCVNSTGLASIKEGIATL